MDSNYINDEDFMEDDEVEVTTSKSEAPNPFGGSKSRSSPLNWIKFRSGLFTMPVAFDTPGAVVVTTKNNKIRHELQSKEIRNARIVDIYTREDSYNNQPRTDLCLRVRFDNGAPDAVISFNASAHSAAKLIASLSASSFDSNKPFDIVASVLHTGDQPKGFSKPIEKDIVVINVFQGGKYIKPEVEIPQGTVVSIGKKQVVDNSQREQFVIDTASALSAKLKGINNEVSDSAKESVTQDEKDEPEPDAPVSQAVRRRYRAIL